MQVICKFSGLPFQYSNYMLGMNLADIHPVFRAKKKLILSPHFVHSFSKSQSLDEKKLIFLAVLNTTDLIEFREPASPSLQTLESNFYHLMHTSEWLAYAEYLYKQVVEFPHYVVAGETANLHNIGNWIKSLDEIRDQIIRKDIDRDRAAALHQRMAEIKNELGIAASLHRAFTPMLARWALDFASLDRNDERYNRYIKILCSPLADAWVYDPAELKELEHYLENELPIDHPQVISVMAQVRLFISARKTGYKDFSVFSEDDESGEGFTILEEDGEGNFVARKSQHLIDVPTEEPLIGNYKSKVEFLRAQAKWKLATREVSPQQSFRKLIKPDIEQIVTTEDV
jgi:hypothetical protein